MLQQAVIIPRNARNTVRFVFLSAFLVAALVRHITTGEIVLSGDSVSSHGRGICSVTESALLSAVFVAAVPLVLSSNTPVSTVRPDG